MQAAVVIGEGNAQIANSEKGRSFDHMDNVFTLSFDPCFQPGSKDIEKMDVCAMCTRTHPFFRVLYEGSDG